MKTQSQGIIELCPVRPSPDRLFLNPTVEVEERRGSSAADSGSQNVQERADDFARRIEELEGTLSRDERRRPIVSFVPERPIEAETR